MMDGIADRLLAVVGGAATVGAMYAAVHVFGTSLGISHARRPSQQQLKREDSGVLTPFISITPWVKVYFRAPAMLAVSYLGSTVCKLVAHPNTVPLSEFFKLTPNIVYGAGLTIFGISGYLYYSSVAYMVKVGTPVPHGYEVKTLCRHGPFEHFKHPQYTGLFGSAVAAALVLDSAWAFISPSLFYLYLFLIVVPREEKYMKDKFGKEYEKFSNRFTIFPA
mmetsp:Transcript_24993/g.57460  ORF Transcript_24993/g.57460 Transcript_24993/m.57460 type:complete len:221 (+) Transcript_24993:97-759(+)